ncbi:MAG: hypothetical protein JW836_12865 [Deltaproteobacteria bacterium]|nr:hypothetical protein [Deltaproteobacteria bacterium]
MKCLFHPDRDAAVKCNKMDVGYCRECLDRCEACTDPCGYCKFRNQCIIWEICKKSEKKKRMESHAKGKASSAEASK